MKFVIILCLLGWGFPNETLVENPSFPGGQEVLEDFIQKHTVYPEAALEEELETKVTVILQIDQRGSVTGIHFPEPLHPVFQSSIVQLVEHMPDWRPAQINGKPVRASISLSIDFKLTD